MAYEEAIVKLSRPAGEDLSDRSKLYTVVKLTVDGVKTPTALTDRPFGILQNDPKVGEAAAIGVQGVSKLVAGAAINVGDPISANTAGKGIVGAAGAHIFGIAETPAAANEVFSVAINTLATPKA